MTAKRDVAVIIEAPVQFFSIQSTINAIMASGNTLDVIVPYLEDYKVVTGAAKSLLDNSNCSFITTEEIGNREYKVCLAPYPVINFAHINAKYRIRYGYSILTAKPNPTYAPAQKLWFDAIICHGPQEAEMMTAYTQAYNISPMKYDGFTKTKQDGKPVLLYLPTSGDVSSADKVEDIIATLKDEYRVIVRMHAHIAHGQNSEEKRRYDIINKLADEVCDDMTPLTDWLSIADVVLSDNSGSIYEALYSKTPVAIFTDSVKSRKYGNIQPLHADLVDDGVIPYSNDISELTKIVKEAMSRGIVKKQARALEDNFNTEGGGTAALVDVIESYMNDEVDPRRWWLHQNLAEDYYRLRGVEADYTRVASDRDRLESEVSYFKEAKGHIIIDRIYRPYRSIVKRLRRGK